MTDTAILTIVINGHELMHTVINYDICLTDGLKNVKEDIFSDNKVLKFLYKNYYLWNDYDDDCDDYDAPSVTFDEMSDLIMSYDDDKDFNNIIKKLHENETFLFVKTKDSHIAGHISCKK